MSEQSRYDGIILGLCLEVYGDGLGESVHDALGVADFLTKQDMAENAEIIFDLINCIPTKAMKNG